MSNQYKLLVTLHIMAVVAGLGSVSLNALYAAKARKVGGTGASAVMHTNYDVGQVAQKVIFTIPLWGLLAIWASDGLWSLRDTWVWLSLTLYSFSVLLALGVMHPGSRRMQVLGPLVGRGEAGPAEVREAGHVRKRLTYGGAVLNLNTTILIALMVWKPL
jgi:uncharacterized membrane protein